MSSAEPDPMPLQLAYIIPPGVLCLQYADSRYARYQLSDKQLLNLLADAAAVVAGRLPHEGARARARRA